jgi:hypothetical protein
MRGKVAEIIHRAEQPSLALVCSEGKVILKFEHDLDVELGKEVIISATLPFENISIKNDIEDKQPLK